MSGIPYFPSIQVSAPAVRYPPSEIATWLGSRGWNPNGNSGITGDAMFTHYDRPGEYLTWAEAVAYEFYRFINLGSKQIQ